MGNNLFVTGFPYELTQDELGKLFAEFGTVSSVKILMERETGRSRGMGFVVMSTDAEAQAAIAKLNGSDVGHRKMFVNEAREADESDVPEKPAEPEIPAYTGPERRSGKDRRRHPPAAPAAASGERRAWDKKPWEKRPWDKDRKPGFGASKPWEKKPWDKDKKPGFGAGKPWEKKPWDKDRKPGFGDKPGGFPKKKWGAGGPNSGRKPGDFKSKPGGFKHRKSGGFRG